jgi:hypothetical protein
MLGQEQEKGRKGSENQYKNKIMEGSKSANAKTCKAQLKLAEHTSQASSTAHPATPTCVLRDVRNWHATRQ